MATINIFAGARSPESITVTWARRDPALDLAAVASAYLLVSDRAMVRQWNCDIVSRTDTEIVLRHTFDAAGAETQRRGTFQVGSVLTLASGEQRRGAPFTLTVLEYPA